MEYPSPQLGRGWQVAAYVALSLMALTLTAVLLPSSSAYFRRFFGRPNAMVVTFVASVVGAVSLWVLQSHYGFVVVRGWMTLRGLAVSAILATVLAVAIVVADLVIRYPQDMNVPVPQALLFYPAIGFVAEIVFHVLPLTLLLLILTPLNRWLGGEQIIWVGILLVALLEPTFQVLFAGKAMTWGTVYTWMHIFVIALLQLIVFQRYDFVSMFAFRMFYYAYWHILWGVIRLEVLF